MPPTTLSMIAPVASRAYLDLEHTLTRAALILVAPRTNIRALRAIEVRIRAHAEQTFRDHVAEQRHSLKSGLTVTLQTWTSDHARLTYRLLLTYCVQIEQRIADLVAADRALVDACAETVRLNRAVDAEGHAATMAMLARTGVRL